MKKFDFSFRANAPKPDIPAAGVMYWRLQNFDAAEIVAIDTETTGIGYGSEVIEIGAAKIDIATGETEETFDVFVMPDSFGNGPSHLPPKIVELTGITDKMLDEHGIAMYDAINMLDDFIGDCPIVFHNAVFDWTRYIYPFPHHPIPIFHILLSRSTVTIPKYDRNPQCHPMPKKQLLDNFFHLFLDNNIL